MCARLVDEYVTDLIPISETRICDKCGAYTWWAGPRQKTKGRCWDCVPGQLFWICSKEQHTRALLLLLTTFPGSTVVGDITPERYRPDTYTGPDAGPCRRCGRQVRLYGDRGHPFCLDCEGAT